MDAYHITYYFWLFIKYGFLLFYVLMLWASTVGLFQSLTTLEDAFYLVGRKKVMWSLIMAGSALLFFFMLYAGLTGSDVGFGPMFGIPLIAATVCVGVYWQDIRPTIRDLNGQTSIFGR